MWNVTKMTNWLYIIHYSTLKINHTVKLVKLFEKMLLWAPLFLIIASRRYFRWPMLLFMTVYLRRQFETGLTENSGPEIDGPKKNNRLKMSHMKMTDQITRHDFAGREIEGPNHKAWSCRTGKNWKMQGQELPVMDSRQVICHYVQISLPKRNNIQKCQKLCSSYS